MANTCLYYKQQKYVSYNNGATWQPLNEYRKGELYEYDSSDCGYYTMYQWVSVSGEYICDGTTKYQKEKKQVSTDGGQTWSDVTPLETRKGFVIEYNSEDCGYVPPSPSYSGQYLTFVALEDGTFKFNCSSANTEIQYSLDSGLTWNILASNTNSPTVTRGNKIFWKGDLTPVYHQGIGTFSSTKRFDVEGNVMSLLYGDNFEGKTSLSGKTCTFMYLFSGCTKVVSAENLILQATTLDVYSYGYLFHDCSSLTTAPSVLPITTLKDYCCEGMFQGCTSLISVQFVLPATTLAMSCYQRMFASCTSLTTVPSNMLPATTAEIICYYAMFYNCTSLTSAPQLPATTLANGCYAEMFRKCTSLTTTPILPAPTLKFESYQDMFRECSSLNSVTCLATTVGENTLSWLDGVASNGTFTKAASMNDWTTGIYGIPSGWTVQNYQS